MALATNPHAPPHGNMKERPPLQTTIPYINTKRLACLFPSRQRFKYLYERITLAQWDVFTFHDRVFDQLSGRHFVTRIVSGDKKVGGVGIHEITKLHKYSKAHDVPGFALFRQNTVHGSIADP